VDDDEVVGIRLPRKDMLQRRACAMRMERDKGNREGKRQRGMKGRTVRFKWEEEGGGGRGRREIWREREGRWMDGWAISGKDGSDDAGGVKKKKELLWAEVLAEEQAKYSSTVAR